MKKKINKKFLPASTLLCFQGEGVFKKNICFFSRIYRLHDKLYLNHLYFYDKYKKLLSVAWAKIETTL